MGSEKNAKSLSDKFAGFCDGLIGGLMIAAFAVAFGAYFRLTIPGGVFAGIAYLLIQKYLRNKDIRACRVISLVLRLLGVMWLGFLVWTVFGIGKNDPKLYPIKKSLYIAGNYSDSSLLGFMPEKLPECWGYDANIVPPMVGQDAQGYINIRFYTDEEGIAYLRSQAESRGGERYDYLPDETQADTEPYSKLIHYAKYADANSKGDDMTVTEIYTFGQESMSHRPCYLLNSETGQVVLHW